MKNVFHILFCIFSLFDIQSSDILSNNVVTRHQSVSEPVSSFSISQTSTLSSPSTRTHEHSNAGFGDGGHGIGPNHFENMPQSPILLSSPLFRNPGTELERLTLRKELDEVKQRLDTVLILQIGNKTNKDNFIFLPN